MQFHIENMTCGGCVRGVTKAINSVDPNATVAATPETHLVDVKTNASRDALEKALKEAGFAPSAA